MGRAPCCEKTLVKRGPWSPEEDAMLKSYIEAHGTGGNWIALPQKIGLKRCGKSCRLRWLNYLRPNLKHGGFSDEEDNIICSLYISIGSRWSVIAAQLPGRTDNDIKNYWNTKLKKKLLGRRKQGSNIGSPSSYTTDVTKDVMSEETQRLSNSALERLQLHIQLQNSSHNNNRPTLWPKLLHPAQERMIENLKAMHNDRNPPHPRHNDLPKMETAKTGNYQKFDELVGVSSHQIDATMHGLEQLMGTPPNLSSFQLQAEFFNDRSIETNNSGRKEAHGGFWWASEMDGKSSMSISSEDSSSVVAPGGHMMMFHDYGLGYNM